MSQGSDAPDRVLFEMSYYSDNKDAIKQPFKDLGLKWQFLGREQGNTKGRYAGDDVSVFVLFTSEHADFTLQGSDEKKKQAIRDAWEDHPTTTPDDPEAPPTPAEEQRTKEVRIWEFKEPNQRPGEPDALYERRREAWEEEDPRS